VGREAYVHAATLAMSGQDQGVTHSSLPMSSASLPGDWRLAAAVRAGAAKEVVAQPSLVYSPVAPSVPQSTEVKTAHLQRFDGRGPCFTADGCVPGLGGSV
jgi:hypothetical protein